MRVTAVGSGDAFCSGGRGHTCWLIDDAEGTFMVDFGATALAALKRLGREPDGIGAVHFTHLHGDHIAGWPFLLVDAMYRSRRRSPLVVSGPPGTKDRLQALWSACYPAAAERPLPFALEVRELLDAVLEAERLVGPGHPGRRAVDDLPLRARVLAVGGDDVDPEPADFGHDPLDRGNPGVSHRVEDVVAVEQGLPGLSVEQIELGLDPDQRLVSELA